MVTLRLFGFESSVRSAQDQLGRCVVTGDVGTLQKALKIRTGVACSQQGANNVQQRVLYSSSAGGQ
jgi:hypothetical protein